MSMTEEQKKTYVDRMLTNSARDLNYRFDQLWTKGKEAGWPKEVMDYLMWWEHETCRIPERLIETAKVVRTIQVDNTA